MIFILIVYFFFNQFKAGSRFGHSGTFEVTKNEQQSNSTSGSRPSALKVSVPSDLEGGSFFLVKTQKGIYFYFYFSFCFQT
jgi:hypothetical protein